MSFETTELSKTTHNYATKRDLSVDAFVVTKRDPDTHRKVFESGAAHFWMDTECVDDGIVAFKIVGMENGDYVYAYSDNLNCNLNSDDLASAFRDKTFVGEKGIREILAILVQFK